MHTKLFFLTFLFLTSLQAQSMEQPFKIYDTKHQKEISVNDIPLLAKKADVIFWGEEHNDSIGHQLELATLQALYARHYSVILSMEMFESDGQQVVNEYLRGWLREDFLLKDARTWPNYPTDYRPLIEFAKEKNLSVIAANAPKRYVNMVTRNGLEILNQLDSAARFYLPPLPIQVATGKYADKFANIMGGHEAMAHSHIFESQNLWDATMAWNLWRNFLQYPGYQIFQINGGFHSDEKLGAYSQLEQYAKAADKNIHLFNISCSADSTWQQPDWGKYSDQGDIVILTRPSAQQ